MPNATRSGSIRAKHEARDQGRSAPAVEELIREAHRVLLGAGIHLSPSKISKTCREYLYKVEPTGVSFGDYLGRVVDLSLSDRVGLDVMYKRITWTDRTGENAAFNVDRKRGVRYA